MTSSMASKTKGTVYFLRVWNQSFVFIQRVWEGRFTGGWPYAWHTIISLSRLFHGQHWTAHARWEGQGACAPGCVWDFLGGPDIRVPPFPWGAPG